MGPPNRDRVVASNEKIERMVIADFRYSPVLGCLVAVMVIVDSWVLTGIDSVLVGVGEARIGSETKKMVRGVGEEWDAYGQEMRIVEVFELSTVVRTNPT